MLRHFLQTTQTRPRRWRGPAMLCVGLVLMSLWLAAGCQQNAQRTPTPPTAETPATAQQENTPPAKPPITEEHPVTEQPAATTPDAGTTETGDSPPDDYYGDPLYWIPGIDYETVGSTDGLPSSVPILPLEKQRRLEALRGLYWGPDGKPLTGDQRARMELAVVAEGMAAVDVAKLIVEIGWWPNRYEYAREFMQQAIEEDPDNFEVHLLAVELHDGSLEEMEAGYRRLLERRPNSLPVLVNLGAIVKDHAEAIGYFEKAVQLSPTYLHGYALSQLGVLYQFIGDYEKALAALKARYAIYPSAWVLAEIEAIEQGEPYIQNGVRIR